MNKILIVENERSIRQALRFELEDEGYEVFDACDYPEAISAFKAFECDLIISDLFLNQGDGLQLLTHVKDNTKQVPFIGMTAYPETQLAYEAGRMLKDRLFIKPFMTTVIKDKINELLDKNTTVQAV